MENILSKPDKEDLISKLEEMKEKEEFNPSWVAEIKNYIENSKPENGGLIYHLGRMYEEEEWDSEIVEEIINYIRTSE
jgi:hypothetical protein